MASTAERKSNQKSDWYYWSIPKRIKGTQSYLIKAAKVAVPIIVPNPRHDDRHGKWVKLLGTLHLVHPKGNQPLVDLINSHESCDGILRKSERS